MRDSHLSDERNKFLRLQLLETWKDLKLINIELTKANVFSVRLEKRIDHIANQLAQDSTLPEIKECQSPEVSL